MIALLNFSEFPVKDDLADATLFIAPRSIIFMDANTGARWANKWFRNLRMLPERVGREIQDAMDSGTSFADAIKAANAKYVKTGPLDDPNKWDMYDKIPDGFDNREQPGMGK